MTDAPTRTHDHADDPWSKLRLRGLRQIETVHGVAWSATITHDGVPVGRVEDLGEGGPITIRWLDRSVKAAARAAADRLAGLTGQVIGDPVDDLMEKLAAVHDLSRHRFIVWRIPDQDGTFWDTYKYRTLPARMSRADALAYLQHPARAHWKAELWDRTRAWWVPVADLT